MNIVDFIILIILLLGAWRGFKNGLIPSLVNVVGLFLIFTLSFFIKQPISIFLYEHLPFLNFAGIFKGITAINILFYEAVSYGITIVILGIVFGILKTLSKGLEKLIHMTIFLTLPSKILGGILGVIESFLFCFILLYIASVVNTTTLYVKDSKFGMPILKNTPVLSSVSKDLINSGEEIHNVISKNKNDTNQANLESVDVLMKYDILSYDSANKLIESGKLNIDNIESIVEKYKGE